MGINWQNKNFLPIIMLSFSLPPFCLWVIFLYIIIIKLTDLLGRIWCYPRSYSNQRLEIGSTYALFISSSFSYRSAHSLPYQGLLPLPFPSNSHYLYSIHHRSQPFCRHSGTQAVSTTPTYQDLLFSTCSKSLYGQNFETLRDQLLSLLLSLPPF